MCSCHLPNGHSLDVIQSWLALLLNIRFSPIKKCTFITEISHLLNFLKAKHETEITRKERRTDICSHPVFGSRRHNHNSGVHCRCLQSSKENPPCTIIIFLPKKSYVSLPAVLILLAPKIISPKIVFGFYTSISNVRYSPSTPLIHDTSQSNPSNSPFPCNALVS